MKNKKIARQDAVPTVAIGKPPTANNINKSEKDIIISSPLQYLDKKETIQFKTRKLHHWFQQGKVQFATFRLADSLPKVKLDEWRQEKMVWIKAHPIPWDEQTKENYNQTITSRMEKWLDAGYGACHLAHPNIRKIFVDALLHFDGIRYELHGFVVMPNHVHILLSPLGEHTLTNSMYRLKSYTSLIINRALGRSGALWQREMFDRIVRNANEFNAKIEYIKNNPIHLNRESYTLYIKESE